VSASRLTVLRHGSGQWIVRPSETIATVDRLRQALGGGWLQHLFRYAEARIVTHRIESIGRPLKLGLVLRVLSRGRCYVEDERGRVRALSAPLLARWAWQSVQEPFRKTALLDEIAAAVTLLERDGRRSTQPLDLSRNPVYVRSDLSFGLKAGGSVGHVAGVVNHLGEFGAPPVMLTTDAIPTVNRDIEVHCVSPAERFWEYPELPSLVMNAEFARAAARVLADRPLSFVYQRYSLNNFTGARLAADRHVPFVLEYNGSEIWMSRHWGTPLEHEALSARIEIANLTAADLIVVVSAAMRDELVARGVSAQKLLVNANGVEPDRYSPDVDGSAVRREHRLEGKTVIGFIGTFGPWHGAEILARAFGRLIARVPQYRSSVRLLMIGDGVRSDDVRRELEDGNVRDLTVLTGIVPQEEGPNYLAACDILASPHVPNADGTPFFGSPTKLFEYMAMGKGIVASDLDQIGEILEHGRAAKMVRPGDADSLADGLRALIEDAPARAALGAEARRLAVERHTWRAHTARIVDALGQIAGI
jgi:glycosyltransferase involved in cell wall biosynthesis